LLFFFASLKFVLCVFAVCAWGKGSIPIHFENKQK
jgi:hypothetical protein